jgi:AcrR family transcriptional regulator
MSTTDKARRGPRRTEAADGRSKKREREIIDAAAEIFHRKGYSETSVQDVADAVGILKGSLYYYIDSKEDLLFRMLLEVHEDASVIVAETAALDAPPLDRLRAYVERHVEFNTRNLAKIAVYYHDFGLLSPKRKKAILAQRAFYEDFVIGLIKEAQERGEVDPTVDPVLVSNGIFGLVNWIYTWYRPGGPAPTDYLGKLYAEMVVNGITATNMPPPDEIRVSRNNSRKRSR